MSNLIKRILDEWEAPSFATCKEAADALEKAKEYVRHKPGCAMYTPVDASTDCDCGLSEWVKTLGETS